MPRRTYRKIFLDTLEAQAGETGYASNSAMLESLDWPRERYDAIKEQLLQEGLIVRGMGRGGSVGLADFGDEDDQVEPQPAPVRVFISYAHADETHKNRLIQHLSPLRHAGRIDVWHDRKITPGANFGNEISKRLSDSDLVLLLISADFIDSDYCYQIEMTEALELHRSGALRVVPVIVGPCDWHALPFGSLLGVPEDGKAISLFDDRDEGFVQVVQGLTRVVEDIEIGATE